MRSSGRGRRSRRLRPSSASSSLIYAAVERTRNEMSALGDEVPGGEQTARAHRELHAIAGGTEQATQSILQAAEDDRSGRQHAHGIGQGQPRPGARAGYPGSRDADFRGLQFPGPHRPAHHQCDGDAEVRRGARRAADGRSGSGIEQFKPVAFGEEAGTIASSTARSSMATAATPRRTTSTPYSAAPDSSIGRPPDRGEAGQRDDREARRQRKRRRIRTRSATKASTSGATACITSQKPLMRPISLP